MTLPDHDRRVEAAARIFYQIDRKRCGETLTVPAWEQLATFHRLALIDAMSAALAAADAITPAVPEGWQLVPIEPTEHQYEAGKVFVECCLEAAGKIDLRLTYKTMLSAQPDRPAPVADVVEALRIADLALNDAVCVIDADADPTTWNRVDAARRSVVRAIAALARLETRSAPLSKRPEDFHHDFMDGDTMAVAPRPAPSTQASAARVPVNHGPGVVDGLRDLLEPPAPSTDLREELAKALCQHEPTNDCMFPLALDQGPCTAENCHAMQFADLLLPIITAHTASITAERDAYARDVETLERMVTLFSADRTHLSDGAKELADRILGNTCACYAEAHPAPTCTQQRDEVAAMIEGALPAEGWKPSTLIQELEKARELADKYKWQVRDTCTRAEAAEARADALAVEIEHLRGDLATMRTELERERRTHTQTQERAGTFRRITPRLLDGTLCEGCGGFIDDDESMGFPRYCSPECAEGRGALLPKVRQSQKPRGFKPRKVRRRRAALPATEGGECG